MGLNIDARDEMHWALVDEDGVILNTSVCQHAEMAKKAGYNHLIHHEAGGVITEAGRGWTTYDNGKTWVDTRDQYSINELRQRMMLRRKSA